MSEERQKIAGTVSSDVFLSKRKVESERRFAVVEFFIATCFLLVYRRSLLCNACGFLEVVFAYP